MMFDKNIVQWDEGRQGKQMLRVSALHYSTGNTGGVSDFGFSSCTVPNYPLLMSEYFRSMPEVLRLLKSYRSCLGVQKSIRN